MGKVHPLCPQPDTTALQLIWILGKIVRNGIKKPKSNTP